MDHGRHSAIALAMVSGFVCASARADDREAAEEGVQLRAGLRAGASLNNDQALLGGHVLAEDGFALEPVVLVGIGGNHFTMRPSVRAGYTFWIGDVGDFGIMPSAGITMQLYLPVGRFASWCDRVDLDACHGWQLGGELGGGVRMGWARLEAMAGIGEVPAVTITFAGDWSVS